MLFGGGQVASGYSDVVDIFDFGRFTADITPTAQGEVTVSVPEGACTDAAGNPNSASNLFSVTYDIIRPACTITGPASPTNVSPFPIQIDWNEPVAGFDLSDLALTNATASNLRPRMSAATASLWQMRDYLAAASAGTKVLFAGGYLSRSESNVVDVYDSASGTWSIDWLSQPRGGLAAASVGTKVLFGGGSGSSGTSSVVDIYDSANSTWSTAWLSEARGYLAAASVGTKVLFGGGTHWDGGSAPYPSNVVDIYNSASGTWSTATLSEPRTYLAAASVGTKVLFGGGLGSSGKSNVVDIYDSANDTWSTAALSQARCFLAATSAGTKVLFGGGESESGKSNVVDIYDSATDTWSTAVLSQPRAHLAAVSVGTKALFGGGSTGTYSYSNVVNIYDSATGAWSTASLSQPRQDLAAASVGKKLLFGGGYSALGSSHIVDIFDIGRFTVDITPTAQGQVTVSVPEGACTNAAGNPNSASNLFSVTYDGIRPACTITGPASPTNASPFPIQIGWSEPVAGFDLGDLALTNATASNLRPQMTATTAALSQTRAGLAAASVGTKVLFGGGWAGSDQSSVVDIYDSANGVRSTASLSKARLDIAAASVGTKLLFGGGYYSDSGWDSNIVDIYDNATDTWSTSSLSQPRSYLAAASVGTKMLFGGGFHSETTSETLPSNVVDIYDSASGTWSTATLSQRRAYVVATSVGTKVLFGGGWSWGASNVVDIYDSASDTWSTAALSKARYYLAATSAGTKVLFGGGESESAKSNVVDIYDSATDTWSTAALSQSRNRPVAVSVGTKALFGGGESDSGMSNVVDIYDAAADTWSTASLSQPRSYLAAASVGTKALFGGGESTSAYSNVVDIFDFGRFTADITPTAQGEMTVSVPEGACTDAAGNPNTASNVLRVTYDTVGPTCTVTGPASPTASNPILFTISFNESMEDLSEASIAVTGGTKGTLSGSGSGPYTLPVTPSSQGEVTCRVQAGAVHDALGNASGASNLLRVTYDTVGPTCTVTGPASPTVSNPILFTISFNESVSDLGEASIAVTGGTKGTLSGSGSGPYTLPVTPAAQGVVTCQVQAGAAHDALGNASSASNPFSVTYDSRPECMITGPASWKNLSPFPIQIDWNEPVAGFDLGDLALTNATASNLQPQMATAVLSQARSSLAAASVGTKVLFAGGYSDSNWSPSNVVNIYDSATGTWSTTALSQARAGLAAASVGTKVFFGGGYTGGSSRCSDRVDIYDSVSGTWSTARLSQARYGLAAASVGTKVIFAGGEYWNGSSGISSNRVDIYDSATDSWTQAVLPHERSSLAAASVGTKAFFAGGITSPAAGSSFNSNVVDIYDSATRTWSTRFLSQERAGLAAASVGTKVLFAGGCSDSGDSNVVNIYDSATDSWNAATLSQARSNLAAASVGTRVFFAGGGGSLANSPPSNVVDIYDSATGNWSTSLLSQARSSLAAASAGTKVLFAGGNSGTPMNLYPSNVVNIYDSTRFTANITPTAQREVTVSVPEGVCTDATGHPNTASNVLRVAYDNQPPGAALVPLNDCTRHAGALELRFTANDVGGSEVDKTHLYVQTPGSSSWTDTGLWLAGASGTFTYDLTEKGSYRFAARAVDLLGNWQAEPVQAQVSVLVTTEDNSPFSHVSESGSGDLVFPMTDDVDVTVTLASAQAGSSITVTRLEGVQAEGQHPNYFRVPGQLLNEVLVITSEGLGSGWSATLRWQIDPANLTGPIDTVWRFEDGPEPVQTLPATLEGNVLVVHGVTGFSTWYAGNSVAAPVKLSGFRVE